MTDGCSNGSRAAPFGSTAALLGCSNRVSPHSRAGVVIQRELQNPLAQQILEGRIPDGSVVHVTASPLGLVIGEVAAAAAA
jgi:hypothetical protein